VSALSSAVDRGEVPAGAAVAAGRVDGDGVGAGVGVVTVGDAAAVLAAPPALRAGAAVAASVVNIPHMMRIAIRAMVILPPAGGSGR
jgi:hypothetical protein